MACLADGVVIQMLQGRKDGRAGVEARQRIQERRIRRNGWASFRGGKRGGVLAGYLRCMRARRFRPIPYSMLQSRLDRGLPVKREEKAGSQAI